MGFKHIITSFLLSISILMLMIPVIPHHHHTNGLLCMKNDLTTQCESSACHHSTSDNTDTSHHCCCNTDCISAHFIQQAPTNLHCDFKPDYLWVSVLFFEPIFRLLLLPEEKGIDPTDYIESLHSIHVAKSVGLRAPPTFLA